MNKPVFRPDADELKKLAEDGLKLRCDLERRMAAMGPPRRKLDERTGQPKIPRTSVNIESFMRAFKRAWVFK